MVSSGSILAALLLFSVTITSNLQAKDPAAAAVTSKLNLIESGKMRPGSIVRFTEPELNAWVRAEAPTVVRQGFRQPQLVLGNGEATASALVDFLKVRDATGVRSNWLVAKLIQGEKLVTVRADIQSADGRATAHLLRVEVGGLTVKGEALDFLIRNFLLPFYPNAKIDQPFELADHVDHVAVTPAAVLVYISR